MRKIAICVTNDLITDQRVNKVASSLSKFRYEPVLIGRKLQSNYSNDNFITIRFNLLFRKNFLFYAEYNFRLFWHLIFNKYKIILANDLDTLLACFLASKIKRIKLVFDSHEYFSEVPELENNKFTKWFWQKLEKILLPRIKHAYTVSDAIAKEYEEKFNLKAAVIYNFPICNNTEVCKKKKNHNLSRCIKQRSRFGGDDRSDD